MAKPGTPKLLVSLYSVARYQFCMDCIFFSICKPAKYKLPCVK